MSASWSDCTEKNTRRHDGGVRARGPISGGCRPLAREFSSRSVAGAPRIVEKSKSTDYRTCSDVEPRIPITGERVARIETTRLMADFY